MHSLNDANTLFQRALVLTVGLKLHDHTLCLRSVSKRSPVYMIYAMQSAKLAYAFELLDEEGLGYLNRRGVWRFMRSVLSALLGLSTGAADLTAEEVQ
jgi:hypothetical protein